MTLSEEDPSTPLTVSSTSGTVEYCEENGDAVDCATGDPANGDSDSDPKGSKGSGALNTYDGITGVSNYENNNIKSNNTSSGSLRGTEGIAINVDGEGRRHHQAVADIEVDPAASSRLPPTTAEATEVDGGIDRAAVSVGAAVASGMAATMSTTFKSTPPQATAVPEEAGVPVSEAFEGSGRLLGSKSKRSVFMETSDDLVALAAVHDDQECDDEIVRDGDEEIVIDRRECDPPGTSPAAVKTERRRFGEADPSARSSETLLAPAAPTTRYSGNALADNEQQETSPNPPRSASSTGEARVASPVGDNVEPTVERSSVTPQPKGSDHKDSKQTDSDLKGSYHKDSEHKDSDKSKTLKHDDDVDDDLVLVPIDELNDDNGSDQDVMADAAPALEVTKLGKVKTFELSAGSDGVDSLSPPPPPPPPPPPAAAALDGSGANRDPSRDLAPFSIGGELHFPSYSVGRDGGLSALAGAFGSGDDSMQSGVTSVGDRVTEAAEAGDVRAIEAFIDRGGDLETRDSRLGATMLGWATRRGHLEVIRLLLARGAKIMARDSKLRTPLHRACTGCHADVVKVLLENRADPNARDMTGRTPLHRASRWGAPNCGLLLLDAGADIEARDEEMARTPLHYASRSGGIVTTLMLLDNGANVNAKTAVGNTALHLVCDRGLVENAKLLLEWGADPSLANAAGAIPAEIAAPWVEESVKATLKELLTEHVQGGTTIRRPTVVRSRPEGAAEAEECFLESMRSRRSSRAEYQRSRSGLKSTRDVFGELWMAGGSSRGASGVLSSGEVRLGSGFGARSLPGEGGIPGLDDGRLDHEELEEYRSRSRRGLGSLRKQESERLARAKKKKRQHLDAGGECHCTVQ